MNGSYNNTLDDVLANAGAEIAWMSKNKTSPLGWDYVSLYCSESKMNSADFPNAVLQCYLKKIKIGIAWSSPTQVDSIVAYNARQTDVRKKITFATTELEAEYANNNCTIAQFRQWVKDSYPKFKNAGIISKTYEGWNYNYDITVPYTDGFLLHAYRTSTQMLAHDDMWNYWVQAGKDRLPLITAQAKLSQKIVEVSLLPSCEPAYGFDFYKTRPWGAALPIIQESFNRLATQDMKDFIIISGEFVFVSKYMKQIKP